MNDLLPDGSIVQDGMRFKYREDYPHENIQYIGFPVRAMVTKVYYIDDSENIDSETTVCDVFVASMGVDLYKLPFMLPKAGVDNYISYQPVPATGNVDLITPFSSKKLDPSVANGDTVIVMFIDGEVSQGIIMGMHPHNQSASSDFCPSPREGKAAGDSLKMRFNGTNFIIDKDGNVVIENTDTLLDPRKTIPTKKKFTVSLSINPPKSTTPLNQKVILDLDNSGSGLATLKTTNLLGKNQIIELDAGADSITLTNENTAGNNVVTLNSSGITIDVAVGDVALNVTTGKVDLVATAGDVSITATAGKVDITGAQDVSLKSDTANVKIDSTQKTIITALTNVEITATAQCKINATATVDVVAPFINLNKVAGGMVVTSITSPLIDLISGAAQIGVATVLAG